MLDGDFGGEAHQAIQEATMSDTRSLDDLGCTYWTELAEVMGQFAFDDDHKIPAKYQRMALWEVVALMKFYKQLSNRQYKVCFNKLPLLWKECGLVPNKIAKALQEMYPDD
jgi:hypothetical protein